MPTSLLRSRFTALRRLAAPGAILAFAMLACGREPTGSATATTGVVRFSQGLSWIAQFPSGTQQFQAAGGTGVEFTKVRVVLNNPDGSVALDTVIAFPPGSTELQVTLSVPLPASAPASGQPLALNLDYQNAAGQTVFHGGPVTVNAVPATPGSGPPPPSQITIPIKYTGTGANATSVRISPKSVTVAPGAAIAFSAQALDANGAVVAGTPIVFSSGNTSFATINAATGIGAAGAARGSTSITAQLFNGGSDAATVTVIPLPSALALVSGGGQTANVRASLADPVVVRVTAADGQPSPGITVGFAAAGGGSVGAASVVTDPSGLAATSWKLGPTPGTQTLTATSAGLGGSPLTVSATARALDPVRLLVSTPPTGTMPAGTSFGLAVSAVDVNGDVATAFTGAVSLSLGDGAPVGGVLSGASTVNAVGGIASFSGLSLNKVGAYTLNMRTPSLAGASSSSFNIIAGPARKMAFQSYPTAGSVAGSTLDPVTVEVRDSLNNVVTSYTGSVTVGISDPAFATSTTTRGRGSVIASIPMTPMTPPSQVASASSLTAVNAVAGVATFSGVQLTVAGTYQLTASAAGLVTAHGPSFAVVPGPAAQLQVVSGNGQTGNTGAALGQAIVVQVTDAYGNAISSSGRTVTFTTSGGGSASPSSTTTNVVGQASTAWTLGSAVGTQSLTASTSGLGTANATAYATGAPPAAGPTGPAYGYPIEFPSPSGHSPNYLLGSVISVPATKTLTHLSFIAKTGGQQVVMALYSDINGSPGTLLASAGPATVAVGVNDLAVSNIVLPAGNYWIMAVFNVNASVGIDYANTDPVKYIPFTFGSPLPTTFPAPIVYSGQRFNYYIRVQ